MDMAEPQSGDAANGSMHGRVVLVERLGGTSHIHFDAGPHRLLAAVTNERLPDVGDASAVRLHGERVHLFVDDRRVSSVT